MKIFISGGCKNGKSTYAQKLAKSQQKNGIPLYYIATMEPGDEEDLRRIARHITKRNGIGFETIEHSKDISKIIKICDNNASFLLDSTTALLSNEMFAKQSFNKNAHIKIGDEISFLFERLSDIVIVSDYIYSDAVIYDDLVEDYRKGLAYIDKICAKKCDIVLEICYGELVVHKGYEYLNMLI